MIKQRVWIHVKDALPPEGKYVLIARKSGYTVAPIYEIWTAKYIEHYKGWTTVGSDCITDSGDDVAYWSSDFPDTTEIENGIV